MLEEKISILNGKPDSMEMAYAEEHYKDLKNKLKDLNKDFLNQGGLIL